MSRRSKQIFFKQEQGGLPPLQAITERTVRFEEVDQLGVVWHGRYVSYLEDGREAFGEKFGLKYADMPKNGFLAPVVQMHIEYHDPLMYKESFTIITSLHWSRAARLNFAYQLLNTDRHVVVTGYTVQVFMDLEKKPLIVQPLYLENFYKKWENGWSENGKENVQPAENRNNTETNCERSRYR